MTLADCTALVLERQQKAGCHVPSNWDATLGNVSIYELMPEDVNCTLLEDAAKGTAELNTTLWHNGRADINDVQQRKSTSDLVDEPSDADVSVAIFDCWLQGGILAVTWNNEPWIRNLYFVPDTSPPQSLVSWGVRW